MGPEPESAGSHPELGGTGTMWGPVSQPALGSLVKWILTSLSFPHRKGVSVRAGVRAVGGGVPGVM